MRSSIAFRPTVGKDAIAAVTEAEAQKYYETHAKQFDRPGRAVLSIVTLDRKATTADSLETLKRITAIREQLTKGAKFEEIAKRESDDSSSAVNGGLLPKGGRGRFVKPFEDAAYKLSVGELSQPIPTQFGFHLIKVDAKKGDTITIRHILKLVKQGDSSATATDRKADQLAKIAAGADVPISHRQIHGHTQILGFAALFLMGIAFHALPRILGLAGVRDVSVEDVPLEEIVAQLFRAGSDAAGKPGPAAPALAPGALLSVRQRCRRLRVASAP